MFTLVYPKDFRNYSLIIHWCPAKYPGEQETFVIEFRGWGDSCGKTKFVFPFFYLLYHCMRLKYHQCMITLLCDLSLCSPDKTCKDNPTGGEGVQVGGSCAGEERSGNYSTRGGLSRRSVKKYSYYDNS